MGGLVRVKVSNLLASVVVLLAISLVNLGITLYGSFQTHDLVQGQRVIQEKITPLCLSSDTVDACRHQINSAKRSVVVRLCKIVHQRLLLPRVECENAIAAVIKRNAAASAEGGSRVARGPPTPGATDPGSTGVGSIPDGPNGESHHQPPGKEARQPSSPQTGGGGGASEGPQTPHGNEGQGQGSGSVGAGASGSAGGASVGVEAEVRVPDLEVPPLVPKAVEGATGAAEGVLGG